MKNFLFLGLMSSVLFFNSCSSNDDNDGTNTPSEPKVLLSKVTIVYYDNPAQPQTSIQTLEYNNQGELIKTLSSSGSSEFEYSNGKPTKTTYYRPDGTVDYYSAYTYNGDLLTTVKAIYTSNPDYNRTITYNYNTNGQMISSSLCQSPACSNPIVDTFTYDGNNISSETSEGGGSSYSTKIVYSYDDKLNPYININKYLKIMMGGAYAASKNNYLTEKISFKSNGVWTQNQTRTSTIQYNSAGFPVQVVSKEANGSLSAQYNYEYITQ
ncbi:hypothetical protein SAMN06265171_106181 [Chryseobacterium rhizoplanae]|uniref:YD repeat-containing protein n=1 Tax=Chryseobacterium rhizoplanae TaxID=1609531 RepID=A0A521DYZ1_9FLAO|nr:hypothetical protein [Chryseobacterium rhizoplanae]SMO76100.1 hypothetical protein SAMN06265171_106181 [Chryseobacterium rhizoplanae]